MCNKTPKKPKKVVSTSEKPAKDSATSKQPTTPVSVQRSPANLPKKYITTPSCPQPDNRAKQTDYTNKATATTMLHNGNLVMINIIKAYGDPSYKKDIREVILSCKDGFKDLKFMSITTYNQDPHTNDHVTIGMKGSSESIYVRGGTHKIIY
jgi:hypothetical protein